MFKQTIVLLLFCISILLTSCVRNNSVSSNLIAEEFDSLEPYLLVPLDTAHLLDSLNYPSSFEMLAQIELDTRKGLSDTIDTLELMWVAYACECQDWVEPMPFTAFHSDSLLKERASLGRHMEFDLDTYGYYIEPADSALVIDWHTIVNHNRVRFIGRLYHEKGYPENEVFMHGDVPKGKVFRYYSYELLKPYRIWGPRVYEGFDSTTGRVNAIPTNLTVY